MKAGDRLPERPPEADMRADLARELGSLPNARSPRCTGSSLSRSRNRLGDHRRMGLQLRNLDRKSRSERREIRQHADVLKNELTRETGP